MFGFITLALPQKICSRGKKGREQSVERGVLKAKWNFFPFYSVALKKFSQHTLSKSTVGNYLIIIAHDLFNSTCQGSDLRQNFIFVSDLSPLVSIHGGSQPNFEAKQPNLGNLQFVVSERVFNLNIDIQSRIKTPKKYRAPTCFHQFLLPFWPPFMHSICLFIFPLNWKERIFPCCLAGHGRKGVGGGL